MKSFSAGACTWQKILLALQVWNLSDADRQNLGPPRKRKRSGLRGERRRKGAGAGFAVRRNRSRADFAVTSVAGCSLFEKVASATSSIVKCASLMGARIFYVWRACCQARSIRGPGRNSSPAAVISRAPAESSVSRGAKASAPPAGKAARRRMSAP